MVGSKRQSESIACRKYSKVRRQQMRGLGKIMAEEDSEEIDTCHREKRNWLQRRRACLETMHLEDGQSEKG